MAMINGFYGNNNISSLTTVNQTKEPKQNENIEKPQDDQPKTDTVEIKNNINAKPTETEQINEEGRANDIEKQLNEVIKKAPEQAISTQGMGITPERVANLL
ncbi:hypothetical protein [Haliovirga abyssi]|uniref:Uncharacterized protein n=1 Tax=Haliovirga abyssi TaxID=2996794 RepID=A0AAU9D0U5_9FUSO|nr:hypothetical protein [Haliovirga abyssi]BDU49586.1 hypothetical protein HLVA_01550 [Haliovirga abyssi]